MNESHAAEVIEFARALFPVTKSERFDSLAMVILACPKPDFAKKVLIQLSHESESLSIPWVKEKINTAMRSHILAIEAKAKAAAGPMTEFASTTHRFERIDAMMADLSDQDKDDLQADVIAGMDDLTECGRAMISKQSWRKNGMIRRLIFERMTKPVPPPRPSSAPYIAPPQRLEFEEVA
jgi:hypothetical protein